MITQLINSSEQLNDLSGGWIPRAETWTRTGNHTFTVGGDVTAVYRKGIKVRYKDGGSYEYGVVGSSSFAASTTTVNLIPNTDYAMAAATVTDTYISYVESPEGFPDFFNYTPTAGGTGLTVGNGVVKGRFKTNNNYITWWAGFTLGSTSSMGTGTVTLTNPLTLSIAGMTNQYIGLAQILDSGTARIPCLIEISTTTATLFAAIVSGTNLVRGNFTITVPMTWATNDALYIEASGLF